MPSNVQTRRIWRNAVVFDGLRTLEGLHAVVVEGEKIAGVLPMGEVDDSRYNHHQDMGSGGVITPGLVDCHTHLVFGGNRAEEFEARLEGVSYEEISRRGGGILSTVNATRQASEDELLQSALPRLDAMIADGVCTVEIKSGYGLSVEHEMKMLRVARRLGEFRPVRVVTTLLGAHALPPEFSNNSDGYIDLVCREMIPAVAREGLADAVDVFCEKIAFSVAQCERVFEAAKAHGLPIKTHSEQLSNLGGTASAARFGALSADHVEYLDAAGFSADLCRWNIETPAQLAYAVQSGRLMTRVTFAVTVMRLKWRNKLWLSASRRCLMAAICRLYWAAVTKWPSRTGVAWQPTWHLESLAREWAL